MEDLPFKDSKADAVDSNIEHHWEGNSTTGPNEACLVEDGSSKF